MRTRVKNTLTGVLTGVLLVGSSYSHAEIIPFDSDRWAFHDNNIEDTKIEHKVTEHLGQQSLFLRHGFAVVNDLNVTDGILEYDIAFEQPGNAYVGAVWRFQDIHTFEWLYSRPHRSGELNATQYGPSINGSDSAIWYEGKEETYTITFQPAELSLKGWTHIKCVFSGDYATVYVGKMDTPVLTFQHELDTKSGLIGLLASGPSFAKGAYYANFSFVADHTPIKLESKISTPEGMIRSWLVSGLVEDKLLDDDKLFLTKNFQNNKWTKLITKDTGYVNLGKIQAVKPEENKNTVFARTTVTSEENQVKRFTFRGCLFNAYKIYLNGQVLFGIDQKLHNVLTPYINLYLPLKKGENELTIAVSRKTDGGWGFEGQLESLKGVKLMD